MGFSKTVALSILLPVLFTNCCYSKKQPQNTPGSNAGFALVELYTSEGCSSCPAAEAALAEINKEYQENVYVMELHVDYWNYIGWKDIFSSSEYTVRQQSYARLFNLGSTYTPQAIINGKSELVGSDRDKLHTIINTALQKKPTTALHLSAKRDGNRILASYILANAKGQLLNAALVQKEAETNVKRGENSGRKLKHINIVRVLKTIEAKDSGTISIDLPAGVSAEDCSIIAFTQKKNTMEVTGAVKSEIE